MKGYKLCKYCGVLINAFINAEARARMAEYFIEHDTFGAKTIADYEADVRRELESD